MRFNEMPVRSLLFVPADSERKLARARREAADAIILDWEDSVAAGAKQAARKLASDFLRGRNGELPAVLIRVHSPRNAEFAGDAAALRALADARFLPDGVMVSKCEQAGEAAEWSDVLDSIAPGHRCSIVPLVESAGGIVRAAAIASCSARITALAFGAEDFCASTGIIRSAGEPELLYARSAIVVAARAAGCDAYDSPVLSLDDAAVVAVAARRARSLGFSGMLAIHPSQLAETNRAFSPTAEEVEAARRVVADLDHAGGGVARSDGRMVDAAVLRNARRVLLLADVSLRGGASDAGA